MPTTAGALQIRALAQTTAPPQAPASIVGLLHLGIEGLVPGDEIAALLRIAQPLPASGWWAQDGEGIWRNAAGPAGGGSVTTDPDLRVAFLLRDGAPGDADGAIDGRVSVDAVLATTEPSLLAHSPDLPSAIGFWF